MSARLLLALLILLAHAGCSLEEGGGAYEPVPLTDEARQRLESRKREFLTLEDIKMGDGSLAAWGRKIEADITVRYPNSKVAYDGPMFIYSGMRGSVFLFDAAEESGALSFSQPGIWLGINGMAVGGKRRITIEPKLVSGGLLIKGTRTQEAVHIRKEKLVVEATLNASCIPVLLRAGRVPSGHYAIEREIWCRSQSEPRRNPKHPIWHVY